MKISMLIMALTLAGCATQPGVSQAPDGTFTAMRRGTNLADPTGPLRIQALKDAEEYCLARGKPVKVLRSRELPSIGQWPEAVISFVCE